MSTDRSPGPRVIEPGAGMDAARMPGHFPLARLGKRVLRPGGIKMTRRILDTLDIQASDKVIEFAPGPGATARLVLARRPPGRGQHGRTALVSYGGGRRLNGPPP